MKIKKFNNCSCGTLIEPTEFWCEACHTFDMTEAEGTDTFLDELFLERQLNDDGDLNIDGVNLIRKYVEVKK